MIKWIIDDLWYYFVLTNFSTSLDVKSWWDAQSGGVKFAIIAVPIIIIALCCCCCCCCRRK